MSKDSHIDRDLDLTNASRGVWLIKVPKYIANRWEKCPGDVEVAKLRISKLVLTQQVYGLDLEKFFFRVQGQKTKVSLTLSEATLSLNEDGEEQIPKDHRLDVSPIAQQTLGVFSHMTREC